MSLSAAHPAPMVTDPPRSDADHRFDMAIEAWFDARLALDPGLATFIGIHDHDGALPDGSHEQVEAEIAFWRSARAEMERVAPGDLTPERAIDRDVVIHEARLHLHRLTELRAWEKATGAAEVIGEALFPLVARDFAPFVERLESIAGRLEAIPGYLAATRTRVVGPDRLMTDIDLESTESLPDFLAAIAQAVGSGPVPAALAGRVTAAVGAARQQLTEHAVWMRSQLVPRATQRWQLGRDGFEELLTLRELGADGDQILAVGEQLLEETKRERDEVAAEIDPSRSTADVGTAIRADHPATFEAALGAYREAIGRARAFVSKHDLATLPPDDRLQVAETPAFMRHLIPFAAYYDPARFDPQPTGTYIVTPPATPEMLNEHSYAAISNTSVHEAYPGHHLQLAAGITHPSLVRLTLTAPEFTEGWAFYTERMMKQAGFDDSPAHRYVHLTDAIWRAVRIVLDVKLQRGEIAFDAAVDLLVRETGFERDAALAEVKSYATDPGYFLSYLYGRHLIDRLRAEVERRMADAFSPKWFHDTLIYGGTLPMAYARRRCDLRLCELDR